MTIQNINDFDNLLDSVVKTHNQIKTHIVDLYKYAVQHAIDSGDWSVLCRLFVKLLKNNICSAVHLNNVLKATNENLMFYYVKERIKQKEGFDKTKTQIVEFWAFVESEKQKQAAFNESKLLESLKNIIKKATRNNIESEKIKTAFGLAVAEIK
ncbi:MAG: hypothetical protein IKT27_02550 [Clostridia bacterium]|nr:hypothetical protein [Clostridia bacterium]